MLRAQPPLWSSSLRRCQACTPQHAGMVEGRGPGSTPVALASSGFRRRAVPLAQAPLAPAPPAPARLVPATLVSEDEDQVGKLGDSLVLGNSSCSHLVLHLSKHSRFFVFGFCLFIRFVKDCSILSFVKYSYFGCLGGSMD